MHNLSNELSVQRITYASHDIPPEKKTIILIRLIYFDTKLIIETKCVNINNIHRDSGVKKNLKTYSKIAGTFL